MRLFSCESNLLSKAMSLRCLFGVHRPSPVSMAKRGQGFIALCEQCARPLERTPEGAWVASEPLDLSPQPVRRDFAGRAAGTGVDARW
jgi:hypothetical protein